MYYLIAYYSKLLYGPLHIEYIITRPVIWDIMMIEPYEIITKDLMSKLIRYNSIICDAIKETN